MGAPEPVSIDNWSVEVATETETTLMDEVEALEDRVFNASLQVKVKLHIDQQKFFSMPKVCVIFAEESLS